MNSPEKPPFSIQKTTALFQLDACDDRNAWRLTQMDGPVLLSGPVTFPQRHEAIEYAKSQCHHIGCDLIIRSTHRQPRGGQ